MKSNVRGRWTLAGARCRCWKCGASTRVYAFVVLPGGEFEFEPGDVDVHTHHTLLGAVTWASSATEREVARLTSSFRPAPSKTAGQWQWANHCESCHTMQGDWHMHCEPDAPFFAPSVLQVLGGNGKPGTFTAGRWPMDGTCEMVISPVRGFDELGAVPGIDPAHR